MKVLNMPVFAAALQPSAAAPASTSAGFLPATAVILSIAAILAILLAVLTIRRVKKQLAEMAETLADVKAGNGNRRLLAAAGDLVSPLAYEINDIVLSYENRLATYRRTEETNRQLMTSLSHDVRTPLTTLIGYLDAAHRGLVAGEEREQYVETARHKAHDLKEYIDILFDWFRLGSGEFAMNPVPVEAAELTRNILIDWIPVLEDHGIEYSIEIPDEPFHVTLDTDGYMRILNNLIQNVLSHSQADRLTIGLSRQGPDMKLTLSDNGIGIEKENMKHIFERLYTCDTPRAQKGTGLGLSIVQKLTEAMGGRIFAESTPGHGTSFTLLFPLAKNHEAFCQVLF